MHNPYNDDLETSDSFDTFKIGGQDVTLFSPTVARITIHVPWAVNEPPTEERKNFVMTKTQGVVNYMLSEGIVEHGGSGLGIMVETQSPKQ